MSNGLENVSHNICLRWWFENAKIMTDKPKKDNMFDLKFSLTMFSGCLHDVKCS